MTCFMGTFQTLAQPMILDFADSATLGVGETVCACGMLVSSLFLGAKGIKRDMSSLECVPVSGWDRYDRIWRLGEYLSDMSVWFPVFCHPAVCQQLSGLSGQNQHPGRTTGAGLGCDRIFIADGYVVAYGAAGAAADGTAALFRLSVGRGAASVVMVAGGLLSLTALLLGSMKSVRALERKLSC